jgi:hypothetical protein
VRLFGKGKQAILDHVICGYLIVIIEQASVHEGDPRADVAERRE